MLDGVPADFGVLKYSSSRFRPSERIESWRATISRTLLRVEIDFQPSMVFHARAAIRIFENIRFATSTVAPHVARRSRAVVSEENDDLFLIINLNTTPIISLGTKQIALAPGNGCLLSCAEPWDYAQSRYGRVLCVRMPRAGMANLLPNLERHIGTIISGDQPAMRILLDYLSAIDRNPVYPDAKARSAFATHIQDLIALLLATDGDGDDFASERSSRTRRERAMKDDLLRNFHNKDLCLDDLATRHDMSRRTIQRVFEKDGTTFQDHVLSLRLEGVRQRLLDARYAALTVSQIAETCGFGDISHFNHVFRRRFGGSPSQIRRDHASAASVDGWSTANKL
jgi:AraC-like DNA-binding protein